MDRLWHSQLLTWGPSKHQSLWIFFCSNPCLCSSEKKCVYACCWRHIYNRTVAYCKYEIFYYELGEKVKTIFGHVSAMWKPNAHYLRITLVKPLCLPGLEDESLLRKDQIPPQRVLALPYTWYRGSRKWKQSYMASKPCKVTSWETWTAAVCFVQGWDPVRHGHQLPLSQAQWACLAASAPAGTLAPVFYRRKFKSNLLASSSFQNKQTNPSLPILLKPWHRQVPLNTTASPWPPPPVWPWSLPNTLDAVTPFPNSFATSLSCPTFLAYISLSALPWVEDKVKHAPELKLQFTSWIWNQAEYQLSKTNLSGCWNNYFSRMIFFVCLK